MSTPETNGRAPGDAPDPDEAMDASAAVDLEDLDPDLEHDVDDEEFDDAAGDARGTEVAFTPRQILGGFALLAGLILLLRRRNRRK